MACALRLLKRLFFPSFSLDSALFAALILPLNQEIHEWNVNCKCLGVCVCVCVCAPYQEFSIPLECLLMRNCGGFELSPFQCLETHNGHGPPGAIIILLSAL